MKLKNIVLFIMVIVATLPLQAASNQSSYDLSTLTRYLMSNNNEQANPTNTQNSFSNQNTFATLNTLLNSTPDAFKSTILDKIPTSWKQYLVKLIEFIKSYLNEESRQDLQRIQNILQQNIAATQQQEHTAAFQQIEQ